MTRPTREQLLDAAVRGLCKRINEARAPAPSDPPQLYRAKPEKVRPKTIKGPRRCSAGEDRQRTPDPVQPDEAVHKAEEWLKKEPLSCGATDFADVGDVRDLAEELCKLWGHPESTPLSHAWLDEARSNVETPMDNQGTSLAIIVGVAAAAAVLAVVFWVRRGRNASVSGHKLAPSTDFRALLRLAEGEGDAASIADELRSNALEPWSWRLKDGLVHVSPARKRALLHALAEHRLCEVSAFAPKAGEICDSNRMAPTVSVTTEDIWVVASDTPDERCGYYVANNLEVHAEVDVCTADWWVLTRPGCTVGNTISRRVDSLIAGGRARATSWRAPWGITYPEDLRELPEATLDAWRLRLIAELNPHYRDRPERQLVLVGKPGEAFDSSMETEDGYYPVGDSVISEVVKREGVPQYGLACPGGSPLLLAVVRVIPGRSGV